MIFIAVCSAIAHAQMYCRDNACSGAYYGSTAIMSTCADQFPAAGIQTYVSCLSDNSIFAPVIADINDDGYTETIIVPSRTTVEVLDKECNIISSLTTSYPINAPPALVNPSGTMTTHDSSVPLYDVAILTNQTLGFYTRYGLGEACTGTCDNGDVFDYMSTTGSKALFGLACTDTVCFATNQPGTTINFYSFTLPGSVLYQGNVTSVSRWTAMNNLTVGYAQKYLAKSYASYCGISLASDLSTGCFVLNSTPAIVTTYTGFGTSGTITAIHDYFAGYVKMGTLYKYLFAAHVDKGSEQSQIIVKDPSAFTNTMSVSGTSPATSYTSLPSISDYDKDGTIEFCYLQGDKINNTDGNISQLICWTNTFLTPKYNTTINRSDNLLNMTFPANFYIADYNFTSAFQYIGTKDGIFEIDGGSKRLVYSSLAPMTAASRYTDRPVQGSHDIIGLDTTTVRYIGNPTLQSFGTSNSWIMRNGLAVDVCGDGICSGSETIVSCPQDCLGTFNGTCNFDVQCTALAGNSSQYNKCLNHTCVKGYTGLTCMSDLDCPPNQSICFSGYCIAGYYGTLPTSIASAQKEYKDNLTYWIDYLLGGSSFIKMIIAIILIIAAMGITWSKMAETGQQPHPIFPLLAGLAMTILCTVFALIPIWFLIIMILGGLIVWLFLRFMLNPGTSGG